MRHAVEQLVFVWMLRDEIAGETGEVVVVNRALAARAQADHFAGAGKMVLRAIARGFT